MASDAIERPSAKSEAGGELGALLEPSLQHTGVSDPIYSVRAGFIVAFFGGIYATLIFSYLNSRKLGRERTDAWLYIALTLIGTAVITSLAYLAAADQLPSWLSLTDNRARDVRYVSRAVALVLFGAVYLRLRPFYTAAVLAGQTPPSPWKAGIAACIAGTLLNMGVAMGGALLASFW